MFIKIDDFDLYLQKIDNNKVQELRAIEVIRLLDKRSLIELTVPGSKIGLLQSMGHDQSQIIIEGQIMGEESKRSYKNLKEKFDSDEPLKFETDISFLKYVKHVLIIEIDLWQIFFNNYKYLMALLEIKK